MDGLVREVPLLSAHGTLLGHLLSCQPLEDAVHVEDVLALAKHCNTRSLECSHHYWDAVKPLKKGHAPPVSVQR